MSNVDCQVLKPKELSRILRNTPDKIPANVKLDFSDAKPSQVRALIRIAVTERKRALKRFKLEASEISQKFIRLPPSKRKDS